MKKLWFILSALCVFALAAPAQQWSLGYWYGGNGVPITSLQWNALTHLSHVAGQVNADGTVTPKCSFGPCTESQLGTEANVLISLAHANGVKVLLELDNVSGTRWNGCASSGNLSACATNIMHLVNAFGYDGVDVDWEASINYTQLGNLLSNLRSQLGSTRLLTFLANAQPAPAPANYAAIAGPADRVNLAIQDQGGNFNPYTWFNNALYSDSNDSEWSVDLAIRRFTAAGIPISKLNPSIDFYGENQAGATGPRQSVSISSNTQMQYQAIVNTYPSQVASATHDSVTHAAWFSPDSSHWINYNDAQSVTDYVHYMQTKGTGGWFLFALEQDYFPGHTPSHALMAVVASARGAAPTGGNTAPTISSTSPLATGSVGTAYSQTLTASGTTPITWGLTSGTIPAGLTLNSTSGLISGTPTAAGSSSFTVQATNSSGNNSKVLSVTITAAPPTISSFTASPTSVTAGASSTLSWSTSGASVLQIDQGVGTVTGTSKSVTPTSTTTYKLTATGSGGSVSATATVTVTIGGTTGPPQPPALPGHTPTDSDLLVAADQCDTTLSANITNSTLSFPVASLSTCVPNQVLFVDSEQVKNCSGASNVFTICSGGRGFAGTTAAAHGQGARVRGRIGAIYYNQIVQEYIAFQTWLAGQTHHGTYPGGTSIGGACWPNHICTVSELYAASDFAESTLSAGIGTGDTSLTLAAASSFQSSEVIFVGQELMKVGSVSGTTLSGLTRGIAGTTPAQHATGSSVIGVIAAFEFERLKLELHAMEADLYGTAGSTQSSICGTSCTGVPGVSWPNHVFATSEAGMAVNGGAFPALWRNRLKDEIKAFAADLSAHP